MTIYRAIFASCVLLLLLGAFGFAQTPATPAAQAANPAQPEAAASSTTAPAASAPKALSSVVDWVRQHKACALAFGSVILFILLVTAALLIAAGRPSSTSYITTLKPSFFFWLGISYLVLLLVIAAFYTGSMPPKHQPLFLGDVLPIAVPWFGAVGAVLVSLEGIFAYGQRDWDPKYNYWHIGRPLFGAVLGIIAFFTYVLIIISSGSVPAFLDGDAAKSGPKDYIIYYIVAFLVGYREETFRELIRRVTDLILRPGSASPDVPVVTFKENSVVIGNRDFGSGSSVITIDIENTGKAALKSPSVSLDKSTAAEFTTANDNLTGNSELKAGEVRSVDIKFAPTTTTGVTYTGVLTVIGSNLTTPAKLSMTGKG